MNKQFSLFFFLLTFLSTFFVQTVFADVISITPTMVPKIIDYPLPYPGLLPTNPLYGLKVFRDRLVGFFISDPLRKSEFDLVMADKRLNAGLYLQEQHGSASLIESTISKGENYFEESLGKIQEAKRQGEDIRALAGKLIIASAKHLQVLHDLSASSKELQKLLQPDIVRMQNFEKTANSL